MVPDPPADCVPIRRGRVVGPLEGIVAATPLPGLWST